jgi:WD40 repeat protein
MDVSPDGRWVATASNDATTKVWDTDTWQEVHELKGHELQEVGFQTGVIDVRFSHDNKRLATVGADGMAIIWDVATGEPLLSLEGDADWLLAVAFSPDGRLLAVGDDEGIITIWDASTGQALLTLVDESPTSHWGLDFSPDGSFLLAGERDGEIEMWQLPADPWAASGAEARLVYNLLTGSGWLGKVPFSPYGERIAVTGLSGQVEVRRADSGELLTTLQHPAAVTHAQFSPDGRRLITAGWDGITRVFALDLEELIELGQSRTTRSLTEEECREYLHLDACPGE